MVDTAFYNRFFEDVLTGKHILSWRDGRMLTELLSALRSEFESRPADLDRERLGSFIRIAGCLSDAFDIMKRMKYAAECETLLLSLIAENNRRFGEDSPEIAVVLFRAVLARNYYVDDDCGDLRELARPLIGEYADEVLDFALAERRTLRNDPVEMTPSYLAVIDEVEGILEQEKLVSEWARKKELLRERGIEWRSPDECNPNVRFSGRL